MEDDEVKTYDSLLDGEYTSETTEDYDDVSLPGWAYALNICDESDNLY